MIEVLQKLLTVLKEGTLPVMLPLVFVCIGIGILIFERSLYLYDRRHLYAWIWPPARAKLKTLKHALNEEFDRYINRLDMKSQDEIIKLSGTFKTPYSRFIVRALKVLSNYKASTRDLGIEYALYQEELAIEKGFSLLSMCAKVAPLLGLLGTVTGMIQTFSTMVMTSTSDPKALSSGISIALIATNVGLVVALPGVIGMGWLSRRAKTLQEEIYLASLRIRSAQDDGAGNNMQSNQENNQ